MPRGNVQITPTPMVAGRPMRRRASEASVGSAENAEAMETSVMPVNAGSAASSANNVVGDVLVPTAVVRLSENDDAVAAPKNNPHSMMRGRMPDPTATVSAAQLPEVVTVEFFDTE